RLQVSSLTTSVILRVDQRHGPDDCPGGGGGGGGACCTCGACACGFGFGFGLAFGGVLRGGGGGGAGARVAVTGLGSMRVASAGVPVSGRSPALSRTVVTVTGTIVG